MADDGAAVLLQIWPMHLLQIEVQKSPSFLQVQVKLPQPSGSHPHETMLSKVSGATGISVLLVQGFRPVIAIPILLAAEYFPSTAELWGKCSRNAALLQY